MMCFQFDGGGGRLHNLKFMTTQVMNFFLPPRPKSKMLISLSVRHHERGNKLEKFKSWCAQQAMMTLDPASQAMLASQSGPYASRAFTTIPYSDDLSFPSHLFRILLLRRLRLPLPLTERSRRCRRVLDPLGDLRAACPRSGVLRGRGCALERAAARNCREAGTRVTTNTLLTDLNIPSRHRLDQRRSEVIANGLPLYHGAQIAVDTTLVSPLTASSQPRRRQGTFAGLHWQMPGVPRNETTQSLSNPIAATSSSSASKWAADSATNLPGSFDSWQQHGHDQSQLSFAHPPQRLLFLAGLPC